jgi:hypothetical protein
MLMGRRHLGLGTGTDNERQVPSLPHSRAAFGSGVIDALTTPGYGICLLLMAYGQGPGTSWEPGSKSSTWAEDTWDWKPVLTTSAKCRVYLIPGQHLVAASLTL